jgi:cellulose synthase/poly-beta-1,6-N-acetylglucosamine synthase-like glycosyltransferase
VTTFLSIVSIIIVAVGALYIRQILFFIKGLSRLEPGNNNHQETVAVIVAARNEDLHIEQCIRSLLRQDYPLEKYAIVVVDDQSTDQTATIVERMSKEHANVRLLRLLERPTNVSPKIYALSEGIRISASDLVFTTDADCVVSPKWLSSMVKHFDEGVGVVSGVTLFIEDQSIPRLLYEFQSIDLFSQTACGAGAIGMNAVNNCNGSNMAFRRAAFTEVGGYSSIARINSGSDSLLAQKIVSATHWQMRFAFEPETQVLTTALSNWGQLLQQRMRWAGQTTNYRPSTLIFLVASFLFYLLLFLFTPVSLVYFSLLPIPVIMIAIKFMIDYWIIARLESLTGHLVKMKYFFLSELLHLPVILIAVFGSFFGNFEWKGRRMEREISQHV